MNSSPVSPANWESIRIQIDKNEVQTKNNFKKIDSKKVLVACSGGADSVALAILCRTFDIDFGVAYIDHGINVETQNSEIVVKELATICDVPFFTSYLDLADNNMVNSNVEAVAETYLINLIRGSGSGAASLVESRNYLFRPVLNWRKSELIDLVKNCGLTHHEDKMNLDSRFVRNRIRNEAIGLLSDIAGRDVTPLIARAAANIARDTDYLQRLAASKWPTGQASTNDLMALEPVLQVHAIRECIQGYPPSTDEMDRILSVARHEILSTQISGNRTIRRSGAVLYQDVTSFKSTHNQEGI